MSKFKVGETYKLRGQSGELRRVVDVGQKYLVVSSVTTDAREGIPSVRNIDGTFLGNDRGLDLVLPKIIHKRYVHWLRYSQSEAIDCCVHDTRHPEHDHLVKIEEITFEEEQT